MLTATDEQYVKWPRPMNVRMVATLLSADQELERLERSLKRNNDRSNARRIAGIRSALKRVLEVEQTPLIQLVAEYRDSESGGFT